MDWAIPFLLGSIVGSFLNVCINRLPPGVSVVSPGSRCPLCSSPIRWYDNVPLLSFLLLKGHCRSCGAGISPSYPAVELTTGLIFVVACHRFGLSLDLLGALVLMCTLLAAAVIDWSHGTIPNRMSLFLIISGLALSILDGFAGVYDALCGGIAGGGSLLLLGMLGKWIFRQPSMGRGDIKLALGIGLFLGWEGMFHVLLLACCTGAGVGLVLRILGRLRPYDPVPFVPFRLVRGICG